MLQTLSGNHAKILAFIIAIAMILLYTMSFATTVFADSENGNRPDHSYSNDGQGPTNDPPGQSVSEDAKNKNESKDIEESDDESNSDEDAESISDEENKSTGKPDKTGTDVSYKVKLDDGALDKLISVTLIITIKDADGNVLGSDTVTIDAGEYKGTFFPGTFTGNYMDTNRSLLDLVATFNWTVGDPTTYNLDHQSAAGKGTVNVFTRELIAPPTVPSAGDNGDTGSNDGDNNGEDDNGGNSDNTTGGDTTTGSTGTTGTSNTGGSTNIVNNSATIEEDLVPESAALELVDDTEEMVQITVMEEEAVPLADVPQTGVAEDTALFILMMLASLAGIAVLARKRDTIME